MAKLENLVTLESGKKIKTSAIEKKFIGTLEEIIVRKTRIKKTLIRHVYFLRKLPVTIIFLLRGILNTTG
jgi:hypothetical protein